jgi:hypothetical protein
MLGLGFITSGCGSASKPILPKNLSQSSDGSNDKRLEMIHPEYANWSKFSVGSQVTRYRVVSNNSGKVEVTSVWKLTKKTDDYVEVVSQVNVHRPGEPLQENPPETTRFASRFKLPDGLSEEFFQLPNINAKKIGRENVEVHGKTVQADIYEWTESNEAGPMIVNLWRSDQVPGRIVRQEMLIESSQTKTIEELRGVLW